jgi:parallel beta-helix repeat protein
VAVADHVGGTNPAVADPGAASSGATFSTSSFVYSAGLSGTAHAVAPVTLGSADITGVDFGFNFSTVVNTNDSGQGSLRQAITNANTLGGDSSLAQSGRTAGIEHVLFMLSNGTTGSGGSLNLAAGGLRSSNNYFSGGVATIAPTSTLPALTTPMVLDAQAQPGWTLNPLIELNGAAVTATPYGLQLRGGSTVRGFIINRFSQRGINTSVAGGNTISGNWLGLSSTGGAASSAMLFGLFIDTAGDVVGGSTAAARNVVSGCSTGGILVNTNASATRITGNYIGTNAAGSAAVAVAGSKNYGVRVLNATGVQIGGTAAGEGNLISGNDGAGVRLEGNGNVVEGNHIGTNLDGTAALANLLSGVQLAISGASTAQGNRIGGTSSAARNVISGNGLDGLHVIGASIANNDIQGNYIGTNAAGTAAVPNQRFGVYIANDASGNRVGGSASGAGNLISGNVLSGVRMAMAGAANAVRGNAIGVNAVGTAALPNGDMGIYLVQSNGQIIGGAEPGAGNVASGNALDGISINDSSSNTVQGNRIGTNAAGTLALPNQRYGVWLTNTSQNNAIGGINAGEGNTIANSGSDGVNISLGDNSGNTIRGNSIFSNAGLGIDLLGAVGVDANDGVKTALQANLLMDSPVLTSARARGNQLTVAGYVGSAANQSTFASAMVEIFVSDQTSSHGSGKTLLGSLTADASGNFSGTLSMPVSALARGVQLTATATDTSGNTSEFGANFTGLLVDFVVNHNGDAADASPGDGLCQTSTTDQCTLRAAIEELNALGTQAAGTPTLAFALPGCAVGGEAACQIAPSSALSAITAPVDINGQTQPGWSTRPLIELNGSGAGASVNGLWLTGGSSSVRGLVINNFSARGLRFSSGSSYTVAGNWIGIRADGLAAAGNGTFGIQSDRPSVTIGGVTDADRNVIAGNGGTGIFSQGETATIYGNWIGLLPDGLSAAPNQRGIQLSGSGITNTTIGGPLAGQGNVISGNQRPAIRIYDAGANSGIRIQGNRIGLAANQDTPVPNATDPVAEGSVLVDGDTQGVLIGGSGAGEGNIIAATSNASAVVLESSAGTPQAIRILGNSMYGSSELGIDLGKDGVSANDGLTSAAQANNGMDYPVFTGAGVADAGTSITVSGYIGTGTGQAVFAGARVEIFVSDANPTGYGEGKTYLGFLTSDANGRFAGTVSVSAGSINVGDPITATATDAAGHTSEFGPNFSSTTMAALSPGSFNAFDTDTAANALTGVLRSRVAGASTSVDVIALDQSSSGLHVGFTGDVSLRWLDARDDSGAVTGSCRSSWVDLGSAGMASFSSNSRLTVNLTPPASATRSMRLQMSYAGTAGTITSCSTDAFAALPASLAWLGASDGDAATAGTTRTLDNTSASGGVVHRAGRPFTVRAEARTATGAVMTGYDGAPTLAISSCVLPSGCTAGALGGGQVAAAAGVYTHSSVTYSEVGAINLSLTDDSFGAVDTADTPAAARTVSASALAVGRFVPDGYVLSVSRQGQFATANAACMASGSAATFFGQGFGWALTPRVTVTAVNAAGATTLLWADALMTLTGAHATPSLAVAGAGAASLSSSFGTMSISALGSGQALIEPNITDRFLLELASGTLQPTQTPTWTWALAVNDSSQAGVSGNPSITANISSSGPTFDQGGSFHAGRLTLAAAYGDARSGVRALVQLQRWTSAGWVTVTEDRGCATVQPQNLGVDQASGVFSTAGVCASPMAGAVTTRGGRAWISLPASPGGATGRLRLTLAGDAASGTACSGGGTVSLQTLALPWLLSGTAGTGPQAMATWGSPRRDLVLRREIW